MEKRITRTRETAIIVARLRVGVISVEGDRGCSGLHVAGFGAKTEPAGQGRVG
jgi:hypothetical protein